MKSERNNGIRLVWLFVLAYQIVGLGTFIFTAFFDGIHYNWWNWIFWIPLCIAYGGTWIGFWPVRFAFKSLAHASSMSWDVPQGLHWLIPSSFDWIGRLPVGMGLVWLISNFESGNPDTRNLKWLLFSFRGRIGRLKFFLSGIGIIFVALMGAILMARSGLGGIIGIFFLIPIIWAAWALFAKRCHDLNHSVWFLATVFFPVLALILWIYFQFFPGTPGANKFGNADGLTLARADDGVLKGKTL